jgi:hypothetical protein
MKVLAYSVRRDFDKVAECIAVGNDGVTALSYRNLSAWAGEVEETDAIAVLDHYHDIVAVYEEAGKQVIKLTWTPKVPVPEDEIPAEVPVEPVVKEATKKPSKK